MRYILLFIHALTITIYQFFFVDPVTLKTNFPATATAGSQFVAEVTISKGSLAGFAKFQMELPEGFTAEESDSKGGTFSVSGQTVKIIWTSVPSASDITVSVKIAVKADANGDKTIAGKYSYIENNVKQQVDFAPVTVKIEGESAAAVTTTETPATSETTAATSTPTTATTEPAATKTEGAPVVSVARTITAGKSAGTYEVELKVNKDGAKGFSKLQEKIPVGYMAVGDKTDGAAFTYNANDHVAKFIWTSLPSQEQLVISYKIMLRKGEPAEKPASLEGEFNYLDNQDSKKYLIAKEELPGTAGSEPVVTKTEPVTTNTVATTEPVKTEPVKTEPVQTEPVKTEPVATKEKTEPTTEVTSPKNGAVMYVVQIGAFQKGIDVSALTRKFGISGIRTEMADGFTKCIFGKHGEYRSARDSRENAKAKGVSDAFVAAYNSGKRITVQEALMITSQKWFR
jgi:cell division septation protein DedD